MLGMESEFPVNSLDQPELIAFSDRSFITTRIFIDMLLRPEHLGDNDLEKSWS